MTPLPTLLLFAPLIAASLSAGEVNQYLAEPVDPARNREVPVKLYVPEGDAPTPVILFSHGLGGSREASPYLGTHWASAGYTAVFIQHLGSDESVWKDKAPQERMASMKQAANVQATLDRYADIPFIIDQLEHWNAQEGHPLFGKLDLQHIGMTGHSFGAVTTQGMMGQRFPGNRTVADPRLDAFLPMSPSSHRTASPTDAFGGVQKPVLCMTGTEDSSIIDPNTTPESRRKVYEALPPGDKYQLVFEGGQHASFGDRGIRDKDPREARIHPAIQRISTAFWDAYLKGDDQAKTWLQSASPKTDLKLDEKDVWEWK